MKIIDFFNLWVLLAVLAGILAYYNLNKKTPESVCLENGGIPIYSENINLLTIGVVVDCKIIKENQNDT